MRVTVEVWYLNALGWPSGLLGAGSASLWLLSFYDVDEMVLSDPS